MNEGIIGKDVAGNKIHDMVHRLHGVYGEILSGYENPNEESEVTTSSWKDVREEVKRWCDG